MNSIDRDIWKHPHPANPQNMPILNRNFRLFTAWTSKAGIELVPTQLQLVLTLFQNVP